MSQPTLQASLNIVEILSPLDWFIFVFVLLATVTAIIAGQRMKSNSKDNSEESFLDLLLMGRKLTLPMFTATLVATWYGGIFGVTQIAFESGIYNFVTQGVFWYITYIIFALFMVDRLREGNAVTLPERVGQMFGPRAATLSGIFTFFNVLPIAYAISLGLFIQSLFGLNLALGITLGVTCVIMYSLIGGFRAVVFSDLVQFFVMCSAVLLVFAFSIDTFGGWDFLRAKLPESHFQPLGEHGLLKTLVWGFIALSTLVDPNFYQRCFAAKSARTAKNGIWIATAIWILFDICTTAGAMYAAAVIPEAASSSAYLTYAIQILPTGLRGFFLAGILATILSTLDSYLFTAGTTLAYDLAPKRWKKKQWLHHLGVISVGLIAIACANIFHGNIKAVWKTLGSYSAACLLFPVVLGFFRPGRISDGQFVTICSAGAVATTVWRWIDRSGFWVNVDDLYLGLLATFSTWMICELINYFSRDN